jgi:hypothetical protein
MTTSKSFSDENECLILRDASRPSLTFGQVSRGAQGALRSRRAGMSADPSFDREIETFLRGFYHWHDATFGFIHQHTLARFREAAPTYVQVANFLSRAWRGKRYLNRFVRDPMVADWLDRQDRNETTARIRSKCLAKFGPDRTPPPVPLASYLAYSGPRGTHFQPKAFPLVARWIRQNAHRFTIDGLMASLHARFPSADVPGRTALHRHLAREKLAPLGHLHPAFANADFARWLHAAAPAQLLDQLHRIAVARLAPLPAPSRSALHRYLAHAGISTFGHRHPAFGDPDFARWLLDAAPRQTLDQLRAAAVARLAPLPAPGRTALHRFIRANGVTMRHARRRHGRTRA